MNDGREASFERASVQRTEPAGSEAAQVQRRMSGKRTTTKKNHPPDDLKANKPDGKTSGKSDDDNDEGEEPTVPTPATPR